MKKYILILLILFGLNVSAQVDWCDSISYSVLPNNNGVFSVMIETTDSLDNYCDTVDVAWAVCNFQLCFLGHGAWASFPIIQLTDTVKVCYNAYIMNSPNPPIPCYDVCEWIVYNGTEWVEWNNVLSVNEVPLRPVDSKAYDLMGRELRYIPSGVMYIKDRKLHIRK